MGVLTKYVFLSGRRDSNPQQPAWKAGTLPIELLPQVVTNLGSFVTFFYMDGKANLTNTMGSFY